MLYFDTSAVLPYYRREPSSDYIETLLRAQSKPVAISELTQVEVASALARWVRTEEINEQQANRIQSAFFEDTAAGRLCVYPVTKPAFERAQHWLLTRRTALRTLDALHLAATEASGAELVTVDKAIRESASFLGLNVRV